MVAEKYNYNFMRTPIFEASELFHRGLGESTDIVSKETYDFKDRGDRMITLRPEGTAGIVRSYVENKMYGDALQPVKVYYVGPMFRYERPQLGRDREFYQVGFEVLGSDDPIVDAELISVAVNIFKLCGLKGLKVNINSLGDSESRANYREIIIDYFKPHINELCDDCKRRLEKNPLRILDCKVDQELPIMKRAPRITDYLNKPSKERFDIIQKYLNILGIDYEVNPNIVRGLDYYNHTVFEIEADVEGFGSQNVICGGGRYNNLVKELEGPETPGMGFAFGFDRLMLALEKEKVDIPVNNTVDAYIMYVNDEEKEIALALSQDLRLSGFKVDMEYLGRNLKGQFKQADRLNSKMLIILNSEDFKNGVIKIKNNVTKKEEAVELNYILYYLDEQLKEIEDPCNCGDECHCDDEHECHCGDDCHCHNEEK
jgi:histidyl-tRNA synthetase